MRNVVTLNHGDQVRLSGWDSSSFCSIYSLKTFLKNKDGGKELFNALVNRGDPEFWTNYEKAPLTAKKSDSVFTLKAGQIIELEGRHLKIIVTECCENTPQHTNPIHFEEVKA